MGLLQKIHAKQNRCSNQKTLKSEDVMVSGILRSVFEFSYSSRLKLRILNSSDLL